MGYCEICKKWLDVEAGEQCPDCGSLTFATRKITDPNEVRKLVKVKEEFKDHEEEIINMIARSGAILEGHFIL